MFSRKLLTISVLALTMNSSAHAVMLCTNEYNDQVQWYVGQPVPSINIEGLACAANNAELNYIYEHFNNIPQEVIARRNYSAFVIWRGDAAVFIVDNL